MAILTEHDPHSYVVDGTKHHCAVPGHHEHDEAHLIKSEGAHETPDAHVKWVEYRLPGSDTIVHRSVEAALKGVPIEGHEAE